MDIKKEDIEELKKHLEFIDKVYYEKIEYLDDADTKEEAFKEGINAAVQALNIHNVSVSLFNEALRVMRDLAEHQNGAPLIRHEEEYNKTMTEVWDFLEANEA